jgi:hypothetical protein
VGNRRPAWASDIDCANWAQFFLKRIVSSRSDLRDPSPPRIPAHMDGAMLAHCRPDARHAALRRKMLAPHRRYVADLIGFLTSTSTLARLPRMATIALSSRDTAMLDEAPNIQYREVVRPPATQVDAVCGTPTVPGRCAGRGRRARLPDQAPRFPHRRRFAGSLT